MNDELRQKLLADIETTGFGAEMRAIQIFEEAGWSSPGPSAYFDRDSKITREIDIKAHLAFNNIYGKQKRASTDRHVTYFYAISAEVKRSSVPWIVFRHNYTSDTAPHMLDAWNNLIGTYGMTNGSEIYSELSRHSLAETLGWRGHGVHEAFKKPDSASRWYSAFVAACKAAEANLAANMIEEEEPVDDVRIEFFFSKPVVILDGQLVAATLRSGEVTLEEIDAATFEFTFQTEAYNRLSYSVDLVTLSWLPEYLSLSRKRAKGMFETLVTLPFPSDDENSAAIP